jgi:hypothetical protein
VYAATSLAELALEFKITSDTVGNNLILPLEPPFHGCIVTAALKRFDWDLRISAFRAFGELRTKGHAVDKRVYLGTVPEIRMI